MAASSPSSVTDMAGALVKATQLAGEFRALVQAGRHSEAMSWMFKQFPSLAGDLGKLAERIGVSSLVTAINPIMLFALAGGALFLLGKPADVLTHKPWQEENSQE